MVMMPEPIGNAIDAIDPEHKAWRIYTSPKGETFRQQNVFELIDKEWLIILCGHYEGVDQRVIDLYIDEELSIGDYVLTGGELPAMVIADCVSRYVDGVISASSLVDESFSENTLEYPQYTRPQVYKGIAVPEVLRSGDHAKVDAWRREQALEITKQRRPDLLK
jgi:tRNA (guanine37-N1)-methyltransferase